MFKRSISLILCVLTVLSMAACGIVETPPASGETTVPTQTGNGDPLNPTAPTASAPQAPETEEGALYEALFDPTSTVSVDLRMPDEELRKMQADYERYRDMGSKSPIYRRADVTITVNGTAYEVKDVGVRMKGNTSRTSFYREEEGGIFRAIHLKLSFDETFDEPAYYGSQAQVWATDEQRQARKDRTFATMDTLELRWNKCFDSTYLRESWAYELYRSEGVLAPMSTLCSMDWSGVHTGVYVINEPVDEAFLEKRLPAEDLGGDLYKCGWTWQGCTFTNGDSIGIEDEDKGEFYCFDLKTNKKDSQHEQLKNLLRELRGDLTKEKLAGLLDLDRFLSYTAVSWFLGNPDDLRNNYNNCYLYFLKSSGKAIIIPYDFDRCLGITQEYDPSGHAMTLDDPFSDKREGAQGGPQDQENPLFKTTIVKGGSLVKEYAQTLQRVANNAMLDTDTFARRFDLVRSHYGDKAQPSRRMENMDDWDPSFRLERASGESNLSFVDYISAKMATYSSVMENVDDYVNYERPVPTGYYIRGDFNDWSNKEAYIMKDVDGIMTFTLKRNHDFSFKVYNDPEQEWLGEESIAEGNTVPFQTDDHGNIRLKGGTYLVQYDPETKIITLTQQ